MSMLSYFLLPLTSNKKSQMRCPLSAASVCAGISFLKAIIAGGKKIIVFVVA